MITEQEITELAKQAGIQHAFDSEGHWDGLTNQTIVDRTPDSESDKAYRAKRLLEILAPFAKLVEERTLQHTEDIK